MSPFIFTNRMATFKTICSNVHESCSDYNSYALRAKRYTNEGEKKACHYHCVDKTYVPVVGVHDRATPS